MAGRITEEVTEERHQGGSGATTIPRPCPPPEACEDLYPTEMTGGGSTDPRGLARLRVTAPTRLARIGGVTINTSSIRSSTSSRGRRRRMPICACRRWRRPGGSAPLPGTRNATRAIELAGIGKRQLPPHCSSNSNDSSLSEIGVTARKMLLPLLPLPPLRPLRSKSSSSSSSSSSSGNAPRPWTHSGPSTAMGTKITTASATASIASTIEESSLHRPRPRRLQTRATTDFAIKSPTSAAISTTTATTTATVTGTSTSWITPAMSAAAGVTSRQIWDSAVPAAGTGARARPLPAAELRAPVAGLAAAMTSCPLPPAGWPPARKSTGAPRPLARAAERRQLLPCPTEEGRPLRSRDHWLMGGLSVSPPSCPCLTLPRRPCSSRSRATGSTRQSHPPFRCLHRPPSGNMLPQPSRWMRSRGIRRRGGTAMATAQARTMRTSTRHCLALEAVRRRLTPWDGSRTKMYPGQGHARRSTR
mmetsp:Transcript_55222/g.165450  ORF Transcript_55222/g.165450 Transcript_55222/m.165450 type:complete len:475 (+) Transcript_55222:634-2058(+)